MRGRWKCERLGTSQEVVSSPFIELTMEETKVFKWESGERCICIAQVWDNQMAHIFVNEFSNDVSCIRGGEWCLRLASSIFFCLKQVLLSGTVFTFQFLKGVTVLNENMTRWSNPFLGMPILWFLMNLRTMLYLWSKVQDGNEAFSRTLFQQE